MSKRKFQLGSFWFILFSVVLICFFGVVICLTITKYSYHDRNLSGNSNVTTAGVQQEEDSLQQKEDGIMDLTTLTLQIVTVGVTLFAMFGGFLSIINIYQSKELETAISNANKALENQQELLAGRLLQEGRQYRSWNRPHYAADSYKLAIEKGEGTFSALLAEYELISMYADIEDFAKYAGYAEDLERRFLEFINRLDNVKHFRQGRKYLKADSYFVLACVYAEEVLVWDNAYKEKNECQRKADKFFRKALEADKDNPDIYRNYAVFLAAAGRKEECRNKLNMAKDIANGNILLTEFMDSDRLDKLFGHVKNHYSDDIKMMLADEFAIRLDEE